MRILVVHNRYRSALPSGENAVVDDESRLLAEFGHDVERLELESDEIANWPLRKKAALPLRVVWSREGYRLTEQAVARARPDVVHFHNTFPLLSPSALWAARRAGATVVQTFHNFRPLCPAGTFMRDDKISEDCLGRFPWPAVRYGCYRGSRAASLPVALKSGLHALLDTWERCLDAYIVPSEFTKTKFIQAGWNAAKFFVKYNTAPDQPLRRSGAGSGFVCVGRLTSEKGVDYLLDAWGQAFPRGEQRLSIIGGGDDEPQLKRRAEALNGVEFVGRLNRQEVLERIASARALVVPSRCYEIFPRVIVEAYLVGVPVIATRLGSLVEIVEDRHTGVLVTPDATPELADALRALASADEEVRRLGISARSAFDEKYSPAKTTARLVQIYETLGRGRHTGTAAESAGGA